MSRSRLLRAIQKYQAPAIVVRDLDEADLVVTLKSPRKSQSKRLRDAQVRGIPLRILKNNTVTQIEHFLQSFFDNENFCNLEQAAMQEAETAIKDVLKSKHPVELSPQNTYLRRLQHQLARRSGLATESTGAKPFRRVIIYPL